MAIRLRTAGLALLLPLILLAAPAPAQDIDGDGVADASDSCPFYASPDQTDTDANGIGDACECGDQTGDGHVNIEDILAIQEVIFLVEAASPLCDTNDDDLCDVRDILGVNAMLFGAPAYCDRSPASCDADSECDEEAYCSMSSGACRDDGTCYRDDDCDAPGNQYPHVDCVGFGVCDQGSCGWQCGDLSCRDLGNVDFGVCAAVLGWGIIDESCQPISGCGNAEGYLIYESELACQEACGDGAQACRATGCSGQVCADQPVFTTCEWLPEYACYAAFGQCERQTNGQCSWSGTPDLLECLAQF